MAQNPDRADEFAQGSNPFIGALRYVTCPGSLDGVLVTDRVLQQFQYSGTDNKNDWYDVPAVNAADLPAEVETEAPKDYPESTSIDLGEQTEANAL